MVSSLSDGLRPRAGHCIAAPIGGCDLPLASVPAELMPGSDMYLDLRGPGERNDSINYVLVRPYVARRKEKNSRRSLVFRWLVGEVPLPVPCRFDHRCETRLRAQSEHVAGG